MLLPRELRFSLFEEGRNALLAIGASHQDCDGPEFLLHLGLGAFSDGGKEQPLGCAEGSGRMLETKMPPNK